MKLLLKCEREADRHHFLRDSAITAFEARLMSPLSHFFDQQKELLNGLLEKFMEQMLDLPDVVFAVSLPAVIKPLGS